MFKYIGFKTLKPNSLFSINRLYKTNAPSAQHDKLKILFFGTDDFSSAHLKALIKEKDRSDSCIDSIDLVCPPDRLTGRKLEKTTSCDTKMLAEFRNINIFHIPEKAKSLTDWKVPSDTCYDLGVVVSFGYFIPPHIISSFKYGAINVHPSLLPKYRGAAPIQHTILNGDTETGVSIQELDEREFDAGKILRQEKVSLKAKLPIYIELKDTLAEVGAQLLVDTVLNIKERKSHAITQNASNVTRAPKIEKEWADLDFSFMTAWEAEQLNRAIGHQYPLRAVYDVTKKKTKRVTAQLLNLFLPKRPKMNLTEPGMFEYDEGTKSLHIAFGDGSVAACSHFKMENKGVINASDFYNGYQKRGSFVLDGVSNLILEKNRKKWANMKQFTIARR